MISDKAQIDDFALPAVPQLQSTMVFGQKICYYDLGAGPVLVLVHGTGGDADEWAFCLDELSRSNRVIAIDLLGFGRSGKPFVHYSIELFVDVLDRFFNALKIERASLLGASLGGWITTAFACKFPGRVEKLILVDAAGLRLQGELPVDLRISTRRHMGEVLRAIFYNQAFATEALVDLAYQGHLARGDGRTIDSVLESFQTEEERLDEKIIDLKSPTLILWGEQDAFIPLRVGKEFQRLIPGSRLEIIPKCGHLPSIEKPAELIRHVKGFVSK